eukprot:6209130-Amphidinium_carterae.1
MTSLRCSDMSIVRKVHQAGKHWQRTLSSSCNVRAVVITITTWHKALKLDHRSSKLGHTEAPTTLPASGLSRS